MTQEFVKLITREFKMSMMGELNFFLGLQIKQTPTCTLIHQQKYWKEPLKILNMNETMEIDIPITTTTKLDMDETGTYPQQNVHRGMILSIYYYK